MTAIITGGDTAVDKACRVEASRRLNYVYQSVRSERRDLVKSREREKTKGRESTGKKCDRWAAIFTGEKIRDRDDERSLSFPLKVAAACCRHRRRDHWPRIDNYCWNRSRIVADYQSATSKLDTRFLSGISLRGRN